MPSLSAATLSGADQNRPRIFCLTNIFDQNYHDIRGEEVERQLTTPFRRDLFRCLENAADREVVLLSSPPKAGKRRSGRWLPAMETRFFTHRQFFCANWDIPKLRIPLSWIFYARQVLRHVRSGDIVVIDNYEFIYILAARILNCFRRVNFLLVYLDGKHLIDHGWSRILSGLAEWWGRQLFRAACLSTPMLAKRLPDSLPRELVPGFLPDTDLLPRIPPGRQLHFLYAGKLAHSHGVDLLLDSLEYLPKQGWHLSIAGHGPLTEHIIRFARDPKWQNRVRYLEPMSPVIFEQLLQQNEVGLNCQRISHAISGVTFPSKIFTYLAAGLLVISSRTDNVTSVCGDACEYYDAESPAALAQTMRYVIENYACLVKRLKTPEAIQQYKIGRSTVRLRNLLVAAHMLE